MHYVAPARRIAQRTLSTPLPQLSVKLQDISSQHRIAELEFTTIQHHVSSGKLADCLINHGDPRHREYFKRLSSISIQAGFLRGFIDLLFYHDDAWHVLDWKSNALNSYDEEHMYNEMCHHDYVFQYHVYTLALHRLLRLRIPDYDYDKHVGYIYYAFIRGINQENPGQGWFVDKPSKSCIEALDQLLLESEHE